MTIGGQNAPLTYAGLAPNFVGLYQFNVTVPNIANNDLAPVTFTLVNDDPIDHEWLIGDAAFHERHRLGTEAVHGDRPNEVSLPPRTTKTTTLTFDAPGEMLFICHFPGHEAYGMVGIVLAKP